jgi:hypothetical protein
VDVQNRPQAVENFHRCSIRITVFEPAGAGSIRLRSRPRPHAVVEHSKSRRPQLAPALGRFFDIRLWPFKVLVEGDHAMAAVRWPLAMGLTAVAVAIVGVVVSHGGS